MQRRLVMAAVPALVLATMAAHSYGGWASVTLDRLPDYLESGKAVELSWMVRQHGNNPLTGLRGTLEARSGREVVRLDARELPTAGKYAATLVVPREGEWTITVNSGFGNSNITLRPIRAVAAGAAAPVALAPVERGERLFVAKGCVACHAPPDQRDKRETVGPDLAATKLDAAYLALFLADPSIRRTERSQFTQMPNLGLSKDEISALSAYVSRAAVAVAR